ncbi:hypothetical protein AVEN_82998-2 [Araneus ventricosus]|nr:hypothetical protein AVEN_82998-2 [Araneus ventricosus]
MHQSNLLAKKRSRNITQISHFEHAEGHLESEQAQDVYLDSHLPVKKKAKKSLNNSFQNSDSESSEKHNEILQTRELSLDSNLCSRTGSRSPFSLNSKVQTSDFSEKQNEHMQTNESNQTEEDLCMKKSKSISNLDSKIMESALEFSKQNGIEDDLEIQEKLENLIASDSHVQEKIKTFCGPNEKVIASDSENSCVEEYPAENAKQTFSVTSFSLNGKYENSISEHLEKEDLETEVERNIDQTDQEDVALQESVSQNRARTSSGSSNRSNLSCSEILKSSDLEKNMEVQSDLLENQGECSTENNVPVQNTTVQETSVENGNSEFVFSEMDDAEKESENLEKPVEMLGNLMNCETFVQSSRASDSNIKHLESADDSEKQDHDIESPEIPEEESEFSDATLLKKYGIRECSVVLTRARPFTIHYGRPFLKKIAQDAYNRSAGKTNVVNLDRLFRRTRLSQFSSLSRETFEREIMKCIRRLHLRDEFIRGREALIKRDKKQLTKNKKLLRRKIFYDTNSFVIVNEKHIEEKRKALRNRKFPLVLIEQNEEAEFLARKLMESKRMNIEQNKIDNETALNQQHNYHDYRETDQYLEVDESGDESDQSDNEETNPNTDSSDDDALQSHDPYETQNLANYLYTRKSKHSLKEGKELQNSNLDCKESHIGKQQLILDSQQDFETRMIQNHEDDSNCGNSKPCENLQKLQNQNLLDSNPVLESEHNFHLALHSDKLKEVTADSQWPRVLLYPLERTIEKDHAKSPLTASSEVDCISFQQAGDSERTDATSVLKEVAYDESTSECNPPSPGRETPLSVECFDDASEKKSFGTANEEFFVIDEDDDDSEKKSCCSYSEEGSEPDRQLFVTESQGSHQNSSLCPS